MMAKVNQMDSTVNKNSVRLTSLDWDEVQKCILSLVTSGTTKVHLDPLPILASEQDCLSSVEDVFCAQEIIGLGTRPHMESLDLFEPWYTRIKKQAVLKTLELKDVRAFCLETIALSETLKNVENRWTLKVLSILVDAEEPLSAIDSIITPTGDIRSDASETLFRLFREKETIARQVQSTLDKTVRDHRMETLLQDKYVTTREGRWVLPVRSGMQHFVKGVIHASSQTKQTVFIEPETIIPLNNRLRQIEVEIEDEIERLLTDLSRYLFSLHEDFKNTKDLLIECDALFAKAQFSLRTESKRFQFNNRKIFLNDLRHPVMAWNSKKIVANTVQLDSEKQILLLSGPNAGGKTILLKSIGLAAQMARCGLPICAGENSEVPYFNNIQIGIGDAQNAMEELSTFAGHLKILNSCCQMQGSQNLILIDEICSSTDPEEGAALSRAFIEKFARNQVFAVITSHLSSLKTGWEKDSKVLNGSLEFDLRTGRPTYLFIQGVPGDSLAIQTAKRVGVSQEIIDRSLQFITPEARLKFSGLEEISEMKNNIQLFSEHLKKEQKKAQAEKEKYETLLKKLEQERDKSKQDLVQEYRKKIDEMIALAKAETTLKKFNTLNDIKTQLPEIVKAKAAAGTTDAILSADEFTKRYPPGTKVYISHLQQDGLIQGVPNSKGEVMVLAGSIRMNLPWQSLKPADKPANPTKNIIRSNMSPTVGFQDQERSLDFRGKTVNDALEELETALDQAVSYKEDRIKIIHGHGTDALKKAIRTYLSRNVLVKKWKAGTIEQGGDGVTWVELD